MSNRYPSLDDKRVVDMHKTMCLNGEKVLIKRRGKKAVKKVLVNDTLVETDKDCPFTFLPSALESWCRDYFDDSDKPFTLDADTIAGFYNCVYDGKVTGNDVVLAMSRTHKCEDGKFYVAANDGIMTQVKDVLYYYRKEH